MAELDATAKQELEELKNKTPEERLARLEEDEYKIVNAVATLEKFASALNAAAIAALFVAGAKGDELDEVTSAEYTKFVTGHVHPLMTRSNEISKEHGEKLKKDLDKEIGKAQRKAKKAKK